MNETENGPLPSFLHEHADWVTRLSRALVYRDEAEDVAQSTWLQLLRSPPPADCDSKAWIFGVLRRSVLKSNDAKRKAARDQELHRRIPIEFYAPSTDDLVDEIALQRAVSGAVLALPEKYRAVVVLRYYQDLEPNLIAEKLELPVKTVHTRLRRGREQLRQKLDRRFGSRNLWMGLLLPHLPGAQTTAPLAPQVVARATLWSAVRQVASRLAVPLAAGVVIGVPLGIWGVSRHDYPVESGEPREAVVASPVGGPPGGGELARNPLVLPAPVVDQATVSEPPPAMTAPSGELANRMVAL